MRSMTARALGLVALLALALLLPGAHSVEAAEIVYEASVPGSASFGARVKAGPGGVFEFLVSTTGALQGTSEGLGVLVYLEDRSLYFSFLIGATYSMDRLLVQADAMPAGVEVASLDSGYVRLILRGPPGMVRSIVAWGAGLERTDFRILGEAGVSAVVNVGAAYALDDQDLRGGDVNVQAQRTIGAERIGAKALGNLSHELTVEGGLYGLWAALHTKRVCNSALGCERLDQDLHVEDCRVALGFACDASQLSWRGPSGSSEWGQLHEFFAHEPPGAYVFAVEIKADAYGPVRTLGTTSVVLGENASLLLVADVALP